MSAVRGSEEFRVPVRVRAEGRVLVVLACGLIGFATYFAVGVFRGRLAPVHLAIAVVSVLVAAVTIWSQQRRPVLLRANRRRLVVATVPRSVYEWADVEYIHVAVRDGRSALVVALVGEPAPAVVWLDDSALPPIEVLHGIRKVAPDHVGSPPERAERAGSGRGSQPPAGPAGYPGDAGPAGCPGEPDGRPRRRRMA